MPYNMVNAKQSAYHSSCFRHDPQPDEVICPQGQVLPFCARAKEATCSCANIAAPPFAGIARCDPSAPMIVMAAPSRSLPRIKPWSLTALKWRNPFPMRGLANASTQWSLVCSALNLRTIFRSWSPAFPS